MTVFSASSGSTAPAPIGVQISPNRQGGMDPLIFCTEGNGFFEGRLYCAHGFGFEHLRVGVRNGDCRFGGHGEFHLAPAGDAVYHLYACVHLPGIKGCQDTSGGGSGCAGGNSRGFPATNGKPACAESDNRIAYKAKKGSMTGYDGTKTYSPDDLFYKLGSCYAQNLEFGDEFLDQLDDDLDKLGDHDGDEDHESTGEHNPDDFAGQIPSQWDYYAHWANAIGQVVLQGCPLFIGENHIDAMFSEYLFMWQQLSGRAGKETDHMVGLAETVDDLIVQSMRSRWYYVQLPFWFTYCSGHVLRLVTILHASVKIKMDFASLDKCVVVKSTDTKVVKCGTSEDLSREDLHVEIAASHIWTEREVRMRMMKQRDAVITQVNGKTFPLTQETGNSFNPVLNHATIELIWAARRKCAVDKNEHFNFSGPFQTEMLKNFSLSVNGQERILKREAEWFRQIHPYEKHSRIPDAYVYCYCFALFPEDMVISGSLNMSQFETVTINVDLHEGMLDDGPVEFILFSRVWNLLRKRQGSASSTYH